MFDGKKKILITGSLGMIGRELEELLVRMEESEGVIIVGTDLKKGLDLRDYKTCVALCYGMDEVYHLAGIKGNPKMTNERPADFMKMLQFDTNMIYAAQECGVKKFLYTSSIAVENPESDKYPAWAKATGEKLIEAMRIQYPQGTKYCIVRPANVFGKYDNFDNPDAMVVTSLINKASKGEDLVLWGDGLFERDFISAKDVARGMIKVMENIDLCQQPVNLSTGFGTKIRDLAALITGYFKVRVSYDTTKHQMGPTSKVLKPDYKLFKKIGFLLKPGAFPIELKEVCDYVRNKK